MFDLRHFTHPTDSMLSASASPGAFVKYSLKKKKYKTFSWHYYYEQSRQQATKIKLPDLVMEQMITNFFTQFMHKNNSQLAAGPTKPQSKQSGALWIVALKCRSDHKKQQQQQQKYNNNRKKAT